MVKKQKSTETYFYRPIVFVIIFNILTLGFYNLYWFYRQWDSISKNTGVNKHAVWAAIFSTFTFYNLLRHIAKLSDKKITKPDQIVMAASYITIIIAEGIIVATMVPSPMSVLTFFLLSGFISLFYARMEMIVNKYVASNKIKVSKKVRPAEVVIIVIGMLVAGVDATLYSVPNYGIPVLNAQDKTRAQELLKKSQDLSTKYTLCSDENIKVYKALDNTDAAAVDTYNKSYTDCEAVRVEQNKAVDDYHKLILGVYSVFSH